MQGRADTPEPRENAAITIRPSTDADLAGFARALDLVARERRWLAQTAARPAAEVAAFVLELRASGGVHLVAVDERLGGPERVVGWCDVQPVPHEGMRHVGRLGMGVLAERRGRGIGERLLRAAIADAHARGTTRIELEVYAGNARAIALYERAGFVTEGRKRRARVLDGAAEDLVCMALLLPDPPAVPIRLATMDDLPAIGALIEESVRALSVGFLTPEQIDAELRYVIAPDTQLVADGTYYVAVAPDGSLAGAGGWSRRRALHGGDAYKSAMAAEGAEDPNGLLDPAADAARIRAMFTSPRWARRGIGRRLFETARAAAESAGFGSLVLTATMPGVPLYESLGFVPVRRYADPLPNGVPVPVVEMARPVRLPIDDAPARPSTPSAGDRAGDAAVRVRRAEPRDVPAIHALALEIQALHVEGRPDLFRPGGCETPDEIRARLASADEVYCVAERGDDVVGYTYVRMIVEPESRWRHEMRWASLDQMGVRADARGQGIGELLWRAAREWAVAGRADRVVLNVWSFNERARRFYERLGFAPFHHRMAVELRQARG